MAPRKVVITCAVTGAIHTPTMSPHLPITPDQIVADAVAAAEAGAGILHLHDRNPETGQPDQTIEVFIDPRHIMVFDADGHSAGRAPKMAA